MLFSNLQLVVAYAVRFRIAPTQEEANRCRCPLVNEFDKLSRCSQQTTAPDVSILLLCFLYSFLPYF